MIDNDGERSELNVSLRDVQDGDLEVFFAQQQDLEAIYMAAFTVAEPDNRQAFDAKWARIREDETVVIQTILVNDTVAGHVVKFEQEGEPEISYWIGRQFWGHGVATEALRLFLQLVPVRPLYGLTAKDNAASLRVMQKCGFTIIGKSKGFANARGEEIEEYLLKLN
jgi:RimJ/RimL family protein N-acetyltransferase